MFLPGIYTKSEFFINISSYLNNIDLKLCTKIVAIKEVMYIKILLMCVSY